MASHPWREPGGGANATPAFSRQARPPFMALLVRITVCNHDHLDFPQSRLNTWALLEPVLDSGRGKSQASRPLYMYWYSNAHPVTHPHECSWMNVFVISSIPRSVWASHKNPLPGATSSMVEDALKSRSESKVAHEMCQKLQLKQHLYLPWCGKCPFYIFKWWESVIPHRNRRRAEAWRLLLDILLTSCLAYRGPIELTPKKIQNLFNRDQLAAIDHHVKVSALCRWWKWLQCREKNK